MQSPVCRALSFHVSPALMQCRRRSTRVNLMRVRSCSHRIDAVQPTSQSVARGQMSNAVTADASSSIASCGSEFYMRDLPSACIPFTSPEGKTLFREALADGTMECYFPLAAQFRTQEDPAFCGLSTLVMTLNALSIDPRRLWKAPWRWFTEDILECCRPLELIKKRGIDLDLFCCIARCNSASAELVRATSSLARGTDNSDRDGESNLRTAVHNASQTADGKFLVLSYSRKILGQTGGGHFSPLGGYHAGRDMILVLDVARFKYPPHWVPLPLLWKAMQQEDPETRLPRGYVTLRRLASAPLLVFQTSSGITESIDTPVARTAPGATVACSSSVGSACRSMRVHAALRARLEAGEATLALVDGSATEAGVLRVPVFAAAVGPVGVDEMTRSRAYDAVCRVVEVFEGRTRGFGDNRSSSSVLHDETMGSEPRCVDKLSKEHIAATAALLHDLERTPLFVAVTEALRGLYIGMGVSAGDVDSATKADSVDLVASDSDDDSTVNVASGKLSVASVEGVAIGAQASKDSRQAIRAECASHGQMCVRVSKAHKLTMLLLSFWTFSMKHHAHQEASARISVMKTLCSASFEAASPTVQSEVIAMQRQWLDLSARVCDHEP